ncbi:MAG: D-alanyl-D-alanine carboxypeptidase/D-alanyl-D-alanine-endopeptidase [Vicinamibacterales bacterium]|nr:D-alanyl-D-alanine carboxypeptidase/D-alanyl-D-alanine-endopeptidase [Vicinamibacterales bacterium]
MRRGISGPSGWQAIIPVLLCLAVGACATARLPRVGAASPEPPPHALANRLTALLEATAAEPALWTVFVRSLDTGDVLFDHQGDRLVMPASTMKIVTLAVAAERLGWDYRFETSLLSAAPVVDGVLRGDLIVRGSGDPTINSDTRRTMPAFDAWASTLLEAGITAIDGRVIGDDNLVEDAAPGYGWSWDDLAYGYATPGGALQHRDNVALLTVHPGSVAGEVVVIDIDVDLPAIGARVVNRVETVSPGGETELTLKRMPDGDLEVIGTVPASAAPVYRTASVQNPTVFFVRDLKQALTARGIGVSGDAVDLDEVDATVIDDDLRLLATHWSPPLSVIANTLMGVSQNLYAETLLRTLDQKRRPRTAAAGRDVMREVLASWGVDPSRVIVADGSGLSRYNYVTARTLVDVLARMHDDPRHATPFRATLPVAARSGTLETRLTGSAAAGNVHAKTGSMSNVSALSGYVTSADGEALAFAVLANNFPGAAGPILGIIDRLVDQFASSTRSDSGR